MATTLFKIVSFGSFSSGLATVGYQLINADNTTNGSRITAGITERGAGTGTYGATVTFPDGFSGELRWDDGQSPPNGPNYASEAINPVAAGGSGSGGGLTSDQATELSKVAAAVDDQGRVTTSNPAIIIQATPGVNIDTFGG